MTILIEKGSPFFDKEIARAYFEHNKADLDDVNGFDVLFRTSRFFNVYNHGYVGSVFVYRGTDDKNYIGGYAKRKHHQDVLNALKEVCLLYDEVYAQTRHVNAVIVLKKAGFSWYNRSEKLLIKTNFKKEKNNV